MTYVTRSHFIKRQQYYQIGRSSIILPSSPKSLQFSRIFINTTVPSPKFPSIIKTSIKDSHNKRVPSIIDRFYRRSDYKGRGVKRRGDTPQSKVVSSDLKNLSSSSEVLGPSSSSVRRISNLSLQSVTVKVDKRISLIHVRRL